MYSLANIRNDIHHIGVVIHFSETPAINSSSIKQIIYRNKLALGKPDSQHLAGTL
jgi:hypothetical protein